MSFHTRWMIRKDLPNILEIEQTLYSPWNEEDFLRCLRDRNTIAMVCTDEPSGVIAGYVLYTHYDNHLEVDRLVVAPKYRRQRVGERLLNKLKTKLNMTTRPIIYFNVPEENLDVQLWLKANRIRCIDVLKSSGDVTYRFQYSLLPSAVTVS